MFNPEMANFDYLSGHIPEIAGIPYSQFTAFESQPALWGDVLHRAVSAGDGGGLGASSPDPMTLMTDHLNTMLTSFAETCGITGGDTGTARGNGAVEATGDAEVDAVLEKLSRLQSADPEGFGKAFLGDLAAGLGSLVARAEGGVPADAAALDDALARLASIDTVASAASSMLPKQGADEDGFPNRDVMPTDGEGLSPCCPTHPCPESCDPGHSSVTGEFQVPCDTAGPVYQTV
jgi:hypothetical protein